MRVRPLRLPLRLLATLIGAGLIALGLAGCGPAADVRSDVPATQTVTPYAGEWHARYGSSPRAKDGSLLWASESPDPDPWPTTSALHNPAVRAPSDQAAPKTTADATRSELWLRTRLVGPSPYEPTLFLHEVDQCLEAYLDGVLLLRFGPMDAPQDQFVAKRPIYLPLGPQYQGRLLTLRFQSSYPNIGIIRPPLFGGRAELLADTVRRGLPFLAVGMISLLLGVGVLALYLVQRRERLYLLYAALCLLLGPYQLSRSLARGYLFDHPALWRYILVGSFCLLSGAMCAFVAHLFQERVSRYLRAMSLANLLLFVVGMGLTLGGVIHLETFFRAALLFWLPFLISIGVTAIVGLLRGNPDARILAWGLLVTSLLALPQLLGTLDVVGVNVDLRALIALAFLIAMGAILVRRYRRFLKRMADYAVVMSMSLSSNEQSGSHEHAHRTLKALQRLLDAERAFMFLCRTDGSNLSILAARDEKGRVGNLSPASTGHDQRVIEAALRKRRPVSRSRYIRRPAEGSDDTETPPLRQSVMAAPLLVQGRLLGLLYLEAAPSRGDFATEDLDILIELGNQVALTLTATRADHLEVKSTHTRKLLGEQWSLLQAATRLAAGELQQPIVVDDAQELAPLARAIESMRRDLLAKLRELEASHEAVQKLNADLRYQLDKRLQRALKQTPESPSSTSLTAPPLDGDPTATAPAEGPPAAALLGRHYRIISLLAEAAGSRLYEVQRQTDRRRFAAKVLTGNPSAALLARFVREAKILTAVRHPNIVSIVDIDRTADGMMFLVTEHPASTPLAARRDLYGDVDRGLAVLGQVLAGLAALHDSGIVHRNLQPATILVVEQEGELRVKLTDFGLSSVLESAQTDLRELASQTALPPAREDEPATAPGLAGASSGEGRPAWMYRAPELAQGLRHASPHSDMFSLGVIAYELLTGELPLAEPATELSRREEPLRIPPLRDKVRRLQPRLANLLSACLHPDPTQRPTAAALLQARREIKVSLDELVGMLSALGDAKARELLQRAGTRLGLSGDELTPAQALQLLDDLAGQPGLIGVTARFARARAAALFAQPGSDGPKPTP